MKFVLFPTLLEEERLQGAPHLNILGISSKSQRMMRWVRGNIAAKAYITYSSFFSGVVLFCFFNQCRWWVHLGRPSLSAVSLDLLSGS